MFRNDSEKIFGEILEKVEKVHFITNERVKIWMRDGKIYVVEFSSFKDFTEKLKNILDGKNDAYYIALMNFLLHKKSHTPASPFGACGLWGRWFTRQTKRQTAADKTQQEKPEKPAFSRD